MVAGTFGGSSDLSVVAELIGVHTGGRWVLPGSLGHWGSLLVSLFSSGVAGFTGVRPGGRWVHFGSLGLLGCALGFVGFIRDRLVHCGAPCGSSGVVGFIPVPPEGRRVHLEFFGYIRMDHVGR